MRVFLVVMCSLIFMSSFAYAQTTKIGVVDLRRVVTGSKKGKSTFSAVESSCSLDHHPRHRRERNDR